MAAERASRAHLTGLTGIPLFGCRHQYWKEQLGPRNTRSTQRGRAATKRVKRVNELHGLHGLHGLHEAKEFARGYAESHG